MPRRRHPRRSNRRRPLDRCVPRGRDQEGGRALRLESEQGPLRPWTHPLLPRRGAPKSGGAVLRKSLRNPWSKGGRRARAKVMQGLGEKGKRMGVPDRVVTEKGKSKCKDFGAHQLTDVCKASFQSKVMKKVPKLSATCVPRDHMNDPNPHPPPNPGPKQVQGSVSGHSCALPTHIV